MISHSHRNAGHTKVNKKLVNHTVPVNLPRIESHEAMIDISLLDFMGIEEFLSLLKSKTDSNTKDLWRASCTLALQLKASRELLSIGSNLFSNKTNRKILDRLVDSTYIVLNAERVYLMELDASGKELVVTHSREEDSIGLKISVESGVEGEVFSSRTALNISDVESEPRSISIVELKPNLKSKCILFSPIINDEATCGLIIAVNKVPLAKLKSPRDVSQTASFSTNELMLLNYIASNAAIAIKRKATHGHNDGAERNTPELDRILSSSISTNKFGLNGNSSHSENPLSINQKLSWLESNANFQTLLERAYSKLDAERVSIFTYSATNKTLVCAASPDIKGFSIPPDKGIAGKSFSSMRVINVLDCQEDERWFKEFDKKVGYTTRSVLSAPILDSSGLPIGVIQAVNKKNGGYFTLMDEEGMTELCRGMASLLMDKMIAENKGSNGLVTMDGVTLARCAANLMLASTMEELAHETERSVSSLTGCNFTGIYVIDKDKLLRIKPTATAEGLGVKATKSGINFQFLADENTDHPIKSIPKSSSINESSTSQQNSDLHIDSINVADIPSHVRQALQFHHTAEYQKGSPISTADGDGAGEFILGNMKFLNALVIPINAKVHGYNPGICVAIIANSINDIKFTPSNRELLEILFNEFFTCAVNKISDEMAHNESIRSLKTNFHLVNHTLSAMKDYVILLNSEGSLIACNKVLEDLLGVPPPQLKSNGTHSWDGQHYSQWLLPSHSLEIVEDVQNVFATGETIVKDSVLLISPNFPAGLLIDYQIIPIENPELKQDSKPTASEVSVTNSGSQGTGNTPFAVVLIIQLIKKQTVINLASGNYLQELNVTAPIDANTAHGVVEAAHSILNSVRSSFILDKETQANLKSITASLSDASRRLSIASISKSALNVASQTVACPLVHPGVVVPGNIFEWEFNVLTISDGLVLCNVIGTIFQSMFNFTELEIDHSTLARYIMEVGKHYHDRPFHNLQHATCVTHFAHMLVKATKAAEHIKPHHVFGIMISALVHDIDHPGNTNLFEVNSGSELALRYNDHSVLENHHCSMAFRLMRKPNAQILASVAKPIAVEIRKIIIGCIMATDMAVHFDLIDETKKIAAEGWNFTETKDQAFLGKILVHAADLSNPVRPFHMTRQWSERISIEFNEQVTKEQALGMPVLGFMMTPDEKAFCKNEIGFASFVVAPMWRSISLLFPGLNFLVDQLDGNVQTWKTLLEKIVAEENSAKEKD